MTPAEHYAAAEGQLAEVRKLDPGNPASARALELLVGLAQVHATLATVDKDKLWPKQWIGPDVKQVMRPDGAIDQCTCPSLPAAPIARTSVDPDCPVHGGR